MKLFQAILDLVMVHIICLPLFLLNLNFFILFLQDILPLIEDLDNAGIRFVYFSAENELRSRVWNFVLVSLKHLFSHAFDKKCIAALGLRVFLFISQIRQVRTMMRNCKEPRALASLRTLGLILKHDCWDKFAIGSFSSLKVSLHVSPCCSNLKCCMEK